MLRSGQLPLCPYDSLMLPFWYNVIFHSSVSQQLCWSAHGPTWVWAHDMQPPLPSVRQRTRSHAHHFYRGTQGLRMVGRYLSTTYYSWCMYKTMLTCTRGVWAGVPPCSAAVSSLGEVNLVFMRGNPIAHATAVCLSHDQNSVVRGLLVTLVGRACKYIVGVSIK